MLSVAVMLGLTACGGADKSMMNEIAPASNGSSQYAATDSAAGAMSDMYNPEPAESSYQSEEGVDNSAYYADRKLIRTVNIDAETKEFDRMMAVLEAQVATLGGYIEDMYTYNGSSYSNRTPARNASMTARIPKQQLDSFLDTVSNVGNVISRSENVQDVTLTYVDLESRKEALIIEQKRLLELLELAENIDEMIIIEQRLTDVRYELQRMESQLRTYDNKVDFATVILSISEVKELTPVVEETIWDRISHGFTDNLKEVGEGFLDFFVWILVSIPYLVLWAVFIAVFVIVIRLCARRSRKKNAEKNTETKTDTNAEQP